MTVTVRHEPDCPGPDEREVRGRQGDTLLRCRNCARFEVVEDEHDEPELEPEPPPPPPRPAGYRCRPHDQPVNVRGKGCALCAAELSMSKRARRARRRAERLAAEAAGSLL